MDKRSNQKKKKKKARNGMLRCNTIRTKINQIVVRCTCTVTDFLYFYFVFVRYALKMNFSFEFRWKWHLNGIYWKSNDVRWVTTIWMLIAQPLRQCTPDNDSSQMAWQSTLGSKENKVYLDGSMDGQAITSCSIIMDKSYNCKYISWAQV